MSIQDSKKSFFTNLWERRFFQFLATYLATSWGAIQFMEWAAKRYAVVPSAWVDNLGVFILAMLPLVLCVIYFHGRPGDDKWLKFERIFYPINVVVALVMSMFLVDASAESITEKVTVIDVEGVTVVREIPKQEFNKKVVVFPIEGAQKNESWKSVGLSKLLKKKLEQDMRIIVSDASSISDSYEHYSYKPYQDIPFAIKMNISVDFYSDFFVVGKFISDEIGKIDISIYETETGKEVGQHIVEGGDIYRLAENISEIINKEIKLSEVEGNQLYIDLPARDLISSDTAALRLYTEARILISKEPSAVGEAAKLINQSIELDPKCAECWADLAYIKLQSGKDVDKTMDNALKYSAGLPERQQLSIKNLNYLINNDLEKVVKLNKMWQKLYPQDLKPVTNLLNLYRGTLRLDDARVVAKQAIENDHKGSIYLTYANLLIQAKDWEEAEIYLRKYKEKYPKQFEATSLLVDTYAGKGQMDKALEAIDQLIIMKPLEKSYLVKKAELYSKQNKFDEAIKILNDALSSSDSVSDSIANYSSKIQVLDRSMRYKEYGKCRRRLKKLYITNYPPLQYLQIEYGTVAYYNFINELDSIEYHIRDIASQVAPSRQPLVKDVNEFIIKLISKETEGIEESYEKVKPMFTNMGNDFFTLLYESEIKFLLEEYEDALPIFAASIAEAPDVSMLSTSYHEAHLKLGMYDEGLEVVNDLLKQDPQSPIFNLFKAEFLNKLNDKKAAKDVLNLVMKVFNDSDPRCIYTKQANILAEELGI